MLSTRETTSEMGKQSHTRSRIPVRARSHAAGSRATSWRHTEQISVYTGLPMAWQTDPAMMSNPAGRKEKLMTRRATVPMESISAEGLKNPSRTPGIRLKAAQPTHMITVAVAAVSWTVLFTRSSRAAP